MITRGKLAYSREDLQNRFFVVPAEEPGSIDPYARHVLAGKSLDHG
jgi:hypothetical protein